jgi:hypothetical protein
MADDKSDDIANAGQKQGWGATWDGAKWIPAVPNQHGEAMQRHINKSSRHSERVRHGGNPGAGEKVR